ncbi:hypothetical protein [Sphingosinithalassobacter portus]|uniref:hypothetical protein n=1 Tax=Stakelama portus TaxID=2676234 RepID=UPI000D6DDC18|nr:hypothetical protein [Sphingosinithalassobacter portus]
MKAVSGTGYAIGAALAALFFSGTASAQQTRSISFESNDRNGVCYFTVAGGVLPGTDTPFKLELSLRARDSNLGVTMLVNGWDKAQAADPDENFPMTLDFEGAGSTTSRSGGYDSGFWDRAWAGWGAGASSDAALALMQRAQYVRIRFDGVDYGRVDLQGNAGFAYNWLTRCRDRLNGAS